jgi:hypothetical protein
MTTPRPPLTRNDLITADMLAGLPAPVQRYLTYTGVIGKPWIETVRVAYKGQFRMAADRPWMGIRAEQFYTTNPPSFQWHARLLMGGLPIARGSDTYKGAHGHMFGKLLGLFTIFDARGDELDQGTMIRYLNEIMWFPIAFLGDNITWAAVDDHAADVTFTDGGKRVSARMFFDDFGRLMSFITQRYAEEKGSYRLAPWATPMTEYGKLAGLNLPIRGEAVWYYPEGDLCYARLTLTEIAYNVPVPAY